MAHDIHVTLDYVIAALWVFVLRVYGLLDGVLNLSISDDIACHHCPFNRWWRPLSLVYKFGESFPYVIDGDT